MRRKSFGSRLVLVIALALAAQARGDFPFPAEPNRCDTSAQPVGCIPLPNEMTGAAGSCNDNKWKYASTNFCTTDPLINLSPNELFGVSGMHVDTAWRLTTGRSDVLTVTLAPGSDGIDPQLQGLGVSLDALRFDLPPGSFRARPGRWRHRDGSGQTSTPDGLTSVAVRRLPNASYRFSVRGRDAELSTFDGTTDRSITIGLTVGNDCASQSVDFRRVGPHLRSIRQ